MNLIQNMKITQRTNDIGKALKLSNIAVSIQHYDEDERVIRKAYDTKKTRTSTFFNISWCFSLIFTFFCLFSMIKDIKGYKKIINYLF